MGKCSEEIYFRGSERGQAFCGIHASEKTNILKDLDARLGENETALAGFENGPVVYDPAEIVRAGVFVSIDADGGLRIQRGYVRRECSCSIPGNRTQIDTGGVRGGA